MNARGALIAWTPPSYTELGSFTSTVGQVKVGYWPDTTGWSDRYAMTTGACFSRWREMPCETLRTRILSEFVALVVRDGMDPQVVHDAFLAIEEYRKVIPEDTRGAE